MGKKDKNAKKHELSQVSPDVGKADHPSPVTEVAVSSGLEKSFPRTYVY